MKGGDGIGKVKPKYLIICEDIRKKVQDGTYAIHDKLPDGGRLADQYGVSLLTVKRALDLLVAEGYIIRRRGDGTFVRDWKGKQLLHLYSLNGNYRDYQERVTSQVLVFEVIRPSEQVAGKLGIAENDFVYEIIRVRSIDERPVIVEYSYMPIGVIPNLKVEHLERSIYAYIEEELGLKIHSAFVKVMGMRPNELEKEHLHLTDTDFVMETERVSCLETCQTFEYSIAHHVPDVFDFETVLFHTRKEEK